VFEVGESVDRGPGEVTVGRAWRARIDIPLERAKSLPPSAGLTKRRITPPPRTFGECLTSLRLACGLDTNSVLASRRGEVCP
jgi:hypothetical protein